MVGVCSYLLVHFWYTRVAAVKSALNAMFTNRVGDFFLTLGFFAIFFTFGTLDYATVFSIAPYININVITFIAILLLLGAAAKSAQLGLHVWLPMAMEGPTPVSALIHAATMVKHIGNNSLKINIRITENMLDKDKNNLILCKKEEEQKLHPYFITGFSDGESTFSIRISKSKTNKLGFAISPIYAICAEANIENLKLLKKVQKFFGGIDSISLSGNINRYEVSSLKGLLIIINHFENYPLQTTKFIHFKLWTEVSHMKLNKEHLIEEGFRKILSIKAVFPKGLNNDIKAAYPDIKPIIKPTFVTSLGKLNPYWISGFSQADSCFSLSYREKKSKHGLDYWARYTVTQHLRDLIILNRILYTFGCGSVGKVSPNRSWTDFYISNIKILTTVIIPHFDKYPIYGAKLLDYKSFRECIKIINNKEHLTEKGAEKIKKLIYNMNRKRKF